MIKHKIDCSLTNNYIIERNRMCAFYSRCRECPLYNNDTEICILSKMNSKEAIATIQSWSDTHSITNAESFLADYPNCENYGGIPNICPRVIDTTLEWTCPNIDCSECQKYYWTSTVFTEVASPTEKTTSEEEAVPEELKDVPPEALAEIVERIVRCKPGEVLITAEAIKEIEKLVNKLKADGDIFVVSDFAEDFKYLEDEDD